MKRRTAVLIHGALVCLVGTATIALAGGEHRDKRHAGHAKQSGKAPFELVGSQAPEPGRYSKSVYCGDVLSKPGYYRIETDLECTASIRITSSNVHLDFAGHSLTCMAEAWEYPEPLGVPEEDRNVWVKGVKVNFNRFEDPALEPVVTGVRIQNGTIANCAQGISMYKADRSTVNNMTLKNNLLDSECCWARGMELVESHNGRLYRNTVTGNSQGIALFSSSGNTLAGNEIRNNLQDGILLFEGSGNLTRNSSTGNIWGIWLEGSSDNTVAKNKAANNTDQGVVLLGQSTGNRITRNHADNNGSTGMSTIGITVAGEAIGVPIPVDNYIKDNSVKGNAIIDIFEGTLEFSDLSFSTFEPIAGEQCSNTWLNNEFDTALAAADCVE